MSVGNIDLNKIKGDISDLKDKKSTLLMSLQHDADSILAKMSKAYCEIGENAYKLSREQNIDSMATLNEAFTGIDTLKLEYDAKKQKQAEIAARYDEEIDLLEKITTNTQSAEAANTSHSSTETGFCTKCGKPYIVGDDIFCTGCGNKF